MQNLNGYAYIRCSQLSRTLSTAFTPCYQPVKTVTDPSDQGIITTNYQWSPENYIISRLFPVSFSNTYDDSFLVLGIPSVFRVLKFAFVFLVLWRCWLGGKKGIRPVKTELWGAAWLSVWSEVQTCIWPSWCHYQSLSLASVKSRLVLPFRYRLTWVVPEKGPLNGCVLFMCRCLFSTVLSHTRLCAFYNKWMK